MSALVGWVALAVVAAGLDLIGHWAHRIWWFTARVPPGGQDRGPAPS